ncbi:hypothetical protein MXD61_05530, partial [Frankia sp. AgPm24]|uniref:hypothetical protein n=1 Tax=Frankia sp. AgPm24 TaxID=631128 RepID=UPI00200EA7F4
RSAEPRLLYGYSAELVSWAATPVGRGARASTVAVLAVALAVGAHLVACSELPNPLATACGSALALRVCWGSTGRRMSLRRIAGLVACVQAGLHLAFTVTMAPNHEAHAQHGFPTGTAGTAQGVEGIDLLPGGPRMALAHLGAALLLAWWLSAGERLLWRAARGAVAVARRAADHLRRRRRPAVVCPLPARATPRCRPATDRAPQLAHLVHLVVRRGPPNPALA